MRIVIIVQKSWKIKILMLKIMKWVEGLARDARANNSDIRLLASTARPYCHRAPPKLEAALSAPPGLLRAHEHRSAKVCDRLVRLGTKFDGSKVACNSSGDVLPQTNCRVVSVGSNGDPAFESAVHAAAPCLPRVRTARCRRTRRRSRGASSKPGTARSSGRGRNSHSASRRLSISCLGIGMRRLSLRRRPRNEWRACSRSTARAAKRR